MSKENEKLPGTEKPEDAPILAKDAAFFNRALANETPLTESVQTKGGTKKPDITNSTGPRKNDDPPPDS